MSVQVKCHRAGAVLEKEKKERGEISEIWRERERERKREKGRGVEKILNMSGEVCSNNKEMW